MECIESVVFQNTSIKEVPSSIADLIGLRSLNITRSKNLMHLPSTIYQLQHIEFILVSGSSNLVTISNKMRDIRQYMPSNESDLLSLLPPTNSSVSNDDCLSIVFPGIFPIYILKKKKYFQEYLTCV